MKLLWNNLTQKSWRRPCGSSTQVTTTTRFHVPPQVTFQCPNVSALVGCIRATQHILTYHIGEFVERDALTFNVKMYMLADFLNIEALQKLAQSNCAYILDEPKSIASLTTPLLLALDNTNPNDCELRLEVLRFGAEWSHRTDVDANLLKACQDANPLAWAVALQAKDREDGLQDEVNILTNDLSNLRASNLRYQDAINLANRHTSCQNCFDLSRGGLSVSEDGAVLECRNCGHIHTMVSA